MKKLKKARKTVEVVDDILCNCCGKSLKCLVGKKGEFDYCGLEEVKLICGYGSEYDGFTFAFSLCEDCVMKMVKRFKIEPEILDSFGPLDTWDTFHSKDSKWRKK